EGEREAYVARGVEMGASAISEDRRILHNQVLQARVARDIDMPVAKYSQEFGEVVDQFIEQRAALESFSDLVEEPQTRTQVRDDLYKDYTAKLRSIDPGQVKTYTFSGLERAAQQDSPLLLRYRIES